MKFAHAPILELRMAVGPQCQVIELIVRVLGSSATENGMCKEINRRKVRMFGDEMTVCPRVHGSLEIPIVILSRDTWNTDLGLTVCIYRSVDTSTTSLPPCVYEPRVGHKSSKKRVIRRGTDPMGAGMTVVTGQAEDGEEAIQFNLVIPERHEAFNASHKMWTPAHNGR